MLSVLPEASRYMLVAPASGCVMCEFRNFSEPAYGLVRLACVVGVGQLVETQAKTLGVLRDTGEYPVGHVIMFDGMRAHLML